MCRRCSEVLTGVQRAALFDFRLHGSVASSFCSRSSHRGAWHPTDTAHCGEARSSLAFCIYQPPIAAKLGCDWTSNHVSLFFGMQGYFLRQTPNVYLTTLALVAVPNLIGNYLGPLVLAAFGAVRMNAEGKKTQSKPQ